MKTLLVAILLSFLALIVNAQANGKLDLAKPRLEMERMNQIEAPGSKKYLSEKDIAGSAYLDKHFQESYVLKENGVEIKDMRLRYNIYRDNMEFEKDGKVLVVAFPSEIHRIKLGGKTFIYEQYVSANKVAHGYFQLLHEGDFQLLKKYVIKLKIPEKQDDADSLRFVRQSSAYYFRRGNGKIYVINSQKQLIKILQPVHQPVIDFIKANKINGKDELKLIRLMEFVEENEN